MVAFILTRTFTLSGLLVGAFALPAAYAAPVPRMELAPVPRMFTPRQCHTMGCLIAVAPADADADKTVTATAQPLSQIDPGDALQAIAQALGFTWTGLAQSQSTLSAGTLDDVAEVDADAVVPGSFAAAVIAAVGKPDAPEDQVETVPTEEAASSTSKGEDVDALV